MATYTPERLERWAMPPHYFGAEWPDYFRAGVGQSRDSDALERSNFTAMLADLGGESDTVIVVQESHWLVGWVEWIAIHQDDARSLEIADENRKRLDDYPVLDEDAWSELEWTEAADYWDSCTPREKVRMAMQERERYHWLKAEPVWMYGRWDYSTLCNHDSPIATALCEGLRD